MITILGSSVSIGDALQVIVPLVGFLAGWVSSVLAARKITLPAWATDIVKKLGGWETVEKAVQVVARMTVLTPDERRAQAVQILQNEAAKRGVALPTSIANLVVEFAYQNVKKIVK